MRENPWIPSTFFFMFLLLAMIWVNHSLRDKNDELHSQLTTTRICLYLTQDAMKKTPELPMPVWCRGL